MTDARVVAELDPATVVWVSPGGSGNTSSSHKVHLERTCSRLQGAQSEPIQKQAAVLFGDQEICSYCRGDVDRDTGSQYDSVPAIEDAGEEIVTDGGRREGVRVAAELLVREHGREAAISEVQRRLQDAAPDSELQGRALEALSHLKREAPADD